MKKQLRKRFTARRPNSVQTKGRLKVSQHRYTGQLLSHGHTSYPTLLMILLVAGVFIYGCVQVGSADTYAVKASVAGTPPTIAGTIDSPAEGTVFTSTPIHVTGTCPLQTYVNLYRNGVYSGTASCASQQTYDIQTGLFEGQNELQVRVFSFADDPGPYSQPVKVFYNPPKPPVPSEPVTPPGSGPAKSTPPKQQTSSTIDPVIIKTEFRYKGVYVGQKTTLRLTLQGGSGPYKVKIAWGDGLQEELSIPRAGAFEISHAYEKAGGDRGAYTVQVTATDSTGRKGYLQLITIVNDAKTSPVAGTLSTPTPPSAGTLLDGLYKYIVSVYAVIVLMVFSFWLGEWREFKLLHRPAHRH